jgi:polyhydroxyalkanoate synthesis regulator phasin
LGETFPCTGQPREEAMIERLEKSVLTAIGAVALTQKKAEEVVKELREKLNLSEEEGKAFLKKLQEAAAENQQKLQEMARDEVQKACERLGVVSADEFETLKKKVARLEKKLK